MKHSKMFFLLIGVLISRSLFAQDRAAWKVETSSIDPANYYGVTLANGVTGIVSSAEPLKVKDEVLKGAYDYYQRGRVYNI